MKKTIWLIVLLLGACQMFDTGEPATQGSVWQGRRVIALFTKPGYNQETGLKCEIPDRIAAMIDSAEISVDVCIYELSEPIIYNSIVRAYKKGIRVRFAGEIDNSEYPGYIALSAAGVPMRLGNSEKIMHNKYVVVDGRYVTMGSMNYTPSGAYNNNENVLFIDNKQVAAYYTKDFESSFIKGYFGVDKTDHPFDGYSNNTFFLTNDDKSVTKMSVYFTPYMGYASSERVDYYFMNYVDMAQKSIYFAIFAYTHADIATHMVDAGLLRGVKVFGVFDKAWHSANQFALHQVFLDQMTYTSNINIRYDGNDNFQIGNDLHGAKCHNKYMVVDAGTTNAFVIAGSYNFSKAASYKGNDENFVVIFDPKVVQAYSNNFMLLYSQGSHPTKDLGGNDANYQDVTVSEVMWAGSKNNLGEADQSDKFVEIYNNTDKPINISGWQLTGTTATCLYYRILMHIYDKGSVIPAKGYFTVYYSTNGAYRTADCNVDPFLYLHNPLDQNYIRLTLKDKDGTIIDEVGKFDGKLKAIPGKQGSDYYCSMVRVSNNGRLLTSWITNDAINENVGSKYKLYTRATPGGK